LPGKTKGYRHVALPYTKKSALGFSIFALALQKSSAKKNPCEAAIFGPLEVYGGP
jgi:hypothetical protein